MIALYKKLSFPTLLTLLLTFGLPLCSLAQVQNVVAFGNTKDWPGTKGLSDVKVEAIVNNKPVDQVITAKNGKFEIKLFYEKQYQLRFSKAGYVTKIVEVDTRNIPPEEKAKGEFYTNKMMVDMIPIRECLDYEDAEKQPVGKYTYRDAKKDIELDQSDRNRVMAQFEKIKKQYRELDDLQLYVDEGDRAMRRKHYKKAAAEYQKALGLCTADHRIVTKRDSARYRIKISVADSLFGIHKYKRARSEYVKALAYETWRAYPDRKIAEIDGMRPPEGDNDDDPPADSGGADVSGNDVGSGGTGGSGTAHVVDDVTTSPESPTPTATSTDGQADADNSTPNTHPIKTTRPDPNNNASPTTRVEPEHKKPVRYYDPKDKLEMDKSGQYVEDRTGSSQEKWDKIQQAKNQQAQAAATREQTAAANRRARADSLQQAQAVNVDPNDKFKNQTVTEEIIEEGQKTIVTRTVVRAERTFIYKKVEARWGTFYFRDGSAITEHAWECETGGK